MSVVRRFRVVPLLAAALATAGCIGRSPSIVLEAAPALDSLPANSIASSLFLIGDAGAADEADAVLQELVRQGKESPEGSTIVFLGDNVYPRGIPEDTVSTYEEAKRRLFVQASVADSTKRRLIFIPGNHDWDRHRVNGWAQVQRQGNLLRGYAEAKKLQIELLPRGGCPGPTAVQLGSSTRLVLIDTQWWLHSRVRPGFGDTLPDFYKSMPDPDWRCTVATQELFIDSLKAIFRRDPNYVTVLIGHHPLESHGEHGGHHPWAQYLFPVIPTPIASWFWLPIGWIYPLGRKLWGDRQDNFGKLNVAMRREIESTFAPGTPLIYAAGHEHSLEVIRRGDRYLLVSGSGMEDHQASVRIGDSTAFASAKPGFMRVDVMRDGRVRLSVTVIEYDRDAREAYRAWIRPAPASRRTDEEPG